MPAATTTPAIVATAGNGVFAKGQQESVTTITFTGISAADAESRLSATIDWGDGTSSGGSIVQQSAGVLAVTSTHTYASAGVFTGLVTLRDLSSGDTLAMANYSATAVAVTSITATDGVDGTQSLTTTSTSSDILHFLRDSDGTASINLRGIVAPDTAGAYVVTHYVVTRSDGTAVASGALSQSAVSVPLPPPGTAADAYSVNIGTLVNGVFAVTQTFAADAFALKANPNPLTITRATKTGTVTISGDGLSHQFTLKKVVVKSGPASATAKDIAPIGGMDCHATVTGNATSVTITWQGTTPAGTTTVYDVTLVDENGDEVVVQVVV